MNAVGWRRHSWISLWVALLGARAAAGAEAQLPPCDDTATVPNQLMVKFRSLNRTAIDATNAELGANIVRRFEGDRDLYLVSLPENLSVKVAMDFYTNNSVVAYAEPNFIYCPVDTYPDDPLLGSQWGLVGGAGINAPAAWDYTIGDPSIIVADNDTGIDLNHPDLVGNLALALSFVGGSPQDGAGHGTHTAGTMAAVSNNGTGVSGVMWTASLWALKICPSGCSLDAAVAAIDYGWQNGAWLSNNSWGGGSFSQSLLDAISRADQAGVLFVTAAGNNNSNNDSRPFYPCNYGSGPGALGNVICVASINASFMRSGFSNYGRNTVHLGAPGSAVLSTIPGGRYGNMSGTSMASPHVAGVAGLIWSLNPFLSHYDVKNIILSTVRPLPSLPVISGGVLDAGAALASTPYP